MIFKDQYHPAVKKDLKKIDPAVRHIIKTDWIPRLLEDPYCGEALTGILSGIWSFHFKIGGVDYRIAYSVTEGDRTVKVFMIGKRESFYQILRRRLR